MSDAERGATAAADSAEPADGLRALRDALPERVTVTNAAKRFHRIATVGDGAAPECTRVPHPPKWQATTVDDAVRSGYYPCRSCFGGTVDHLDVDADAVVERYTPAEQPEPSIRRSGGLLQRFANARTALPDRAIAKPHSERFHRRRAEREETQPACRGVTATDYKPVDVDEALRAGLDPCQDCWQAVLEYLAADAASPVEYRAADATPKPSAQTSEKPLPSETDDTERPVLSSLTEQVMVAPRSKYHAPAGDETLCGRTGYRVVDRRAVETHFEPCTNCFDEDAIEG